MTDKIIDEIMQSICMSVETRGNCGQLFDSDFPIEYRNIIADMLREKNITCVRISKYADVYFPSDLDECEKIKLIDGYRANAPSAYQAALHDEQEIRAAFSAFMLGAIIADILGLHNDDDNLTNKK